MDAALDCRRCGACCVNLPANRAQGVNYWVEISDGDRILRRPDLVKTLVTRDPAGVPHLRVAHDGRCLSLRGPLGAVTCGIYRERPSACRQVEPGDEKCLRYRALHEAAGMRFVEPDPSR